MSKHSGKIGLYLLLIVALIAGYLYLNDQVSTQGSYTMGQLEKALEEDKVTDAVIHQNREVPTGYVTANIVSDGQKTVYVTDVKEAEEICENYCTLSAVELLNGNGVSEPDPYPEQILHTQNTRIKAKKAQIKRQGTEVPA